MMRRAIASALIVTALIGGTATAATPARWSRFDARRTTSHVVRIVVRTRCLNAEDSAAHLRLREYGEGRVVYGCERKGY